MTLVPTGQVYVDANFVEAQLRKVQIGQCATLERTSTAAAWSTTARLWACPAAPALPSP